MSGCVKVDKNVKGPPYIADNCRSEIKLGNNGKKYISKQNEKGIYKWVLISETDISKIYVDKILNKLSDIKDDKILNEIFNILYSSTTTSPILNNFIDSYPSLWKDNVNNTNRMTFLNSWIKDTKDLEYKNTDFNIKVKSIDHLRVCTFNVHFWLNPMGVFRYKEMLKVIGNIDADIVCLQEAILPKDVNNVKIHSDRDNWSIDNINDDFKKLGYKYTRACATNNTNHSSSDSFFGNIILSKIDLESTDSSILYHKNKNDETRCFSRVTVKYNNSIINIINVHLDVWDETENTRVEQVKELIKYSKNLSGSTIICGDFNALWRDDYTDDEWEWISKNNKDIPLQQKAVHLFDKAGYKESFAGGNMKYSVWTSRRVDYMWYNGDISPFNSNVYYTSESDHYPLVVDFSTSASTDNISENSSDKNTTDEFSHLMYRIDTGKSVKGEFKELAFTHNTPIDTLYQMLKGKYVQHIRCCDEHGIVGRGAQFRYGIDSQYGDIIFIMKPTDWWKSMKGVNLNSYSAKPSDTPELGRWFHSKSGMDIRPYKNKNIKYIDNNLKEEVNMFDFRPTDIEGDATECEDDTWVFTWCNSQLHLSENVNFDNVEMVLAPNWIISDKSAFSNMGIDYKLLQHAVINKLPVLANGEANKLNGKFVLYGPAKQKDAYAFIRNINSEDAATLKNYYPTIKDSKYYKPNGSTARKSFPAGNSSRIAISDAAYLDAEKLYMHMLVKHNLIYKKK